MIIIRPSIALLLLAAAMPAAEAVKRVVVWDGDTAKGGKAWAGPEAAHPSLKPEPGEGGNALSFTGSGSEWIGGIWNWHGWYPAHAGKDTAPYRNLSFRIRIASPGNPGTITVAIGSKEGKTETAKVAAYCPQLLDGQWHEVVIPLVDLKPEKDFDPTKVWQLHIGSWAAVNRSFTILIDDIAFDDRPVRPLSVWVSAAEPRNPAPLSGQVSDVVASISADQALPVSPWIYGVAMAEPRLCHEIGATIRRAGGNPLTPADWRNGFSAKGADWFYQNEGRGSAPEQNWIVDFHRVNREAKLETYLSIPMMGRVAKDGTSCAFDTTKYPGQEKWAGMVQPKDRMPNAGNGRRRAVGADGASLSTSDGKPVWEDIEPNPDDSSRVVSIEEQCAILPFMIRDKGYGRADAGGVRFLALDNEPFLWHVTHRGMHPRGLGHDELWNRTVEAARLLKAADPSVRIAGPTLWGWTAYFYSGRDAQLCKEKKASWDAPPDFTACGGIPFGKWYLQQVASHTKTHGLQPIDILDWHFYPQNGIYLGGTVNDPQVMEARVQETRALWDPAWIDPSWMARGKLEIPHLVQPKPGVVALIRLMHKWIDEAGLRGRMQVSLGEYNFGGDDDVSGGIAQAEIFGIFARERVDHAYVWFAPPVNSSSYFGFKMLRNPDGKGSAVGSTYLMSTVSAPDDVSVHAYRDDASRRLSLVLVNKRAAKPARVTVTLPAEVATQQATTWEYSAVDMRCIGLLPPLAAGGRTLSVDLPAMSVRRIDLNQ